VTLHEDEIEIDLPLVRGLVDGAFPNLAGHPLRPLDASGSSNALFRLGNHLLVRMPRQRGGSKTIAKEARWLPYVAPALPVAVPGIVGVGDPGPDIAERARRAADQAGLRLEVRTVDAGRSHAYADLVPADLVLLVGIFGNIGDRDLRGTIAASPQLCGPGATVVWSRGRGGSLTARNDEVRAAFRVAGFTELDYRTMTVATAPRSVSSATTGHRSRSSAAGPGSHSAGDRSGRCRAGRERVWAWR